MLFPTEDKKGVVVEGRVPQSVVSQGRIICICMRLHSSSTSYPVMSGIARVVTLPSYLLVVI